MTSLQDWFYDEIFQAFSLKSAGSIYLTLKRLGAPESLSSCFKRVPDIQIGLKKCSDGEIPDLELREKSLKRKTGQFYTPQPLAEQLTQMVQFQSESTALDPACGDGSFLMALARRLKAEDGKNSTFLNRLHGYDIDQTALLICLTRLIRAFPGCGWPKLEQRNFLLDPDTAMFDLIIGNPPYRVNLEPEFKQQLKTLYETCEGEKDLYTFFIEGGLKSLKDSGLLVLLTSHTFLVNHQCQKIRQMVFAENTTEQILMLPPRFFVKAPGVLPVVTFVKKKVPDKNHRLSLQTDYMESKGWKKKYLADSADFIDGCGLRQAMVPTELAEVFAKMEGAGIRLAKVCRVGVGIQESQKRSGSVSKFVSMSCASERHRRVLRGREIAPFRINWEGKFIDYGPHLAFAGDEKVFSGKKVLYQNIRNEKLRQRLVAAHDCEGFFPKNSLSYILSNDECYDLRFICGLLNSKLVNAWFSGQFHSFHVTVTQVRQIPLPLFDKKHFKRVIGLSHRLSALQEDSQDRNEIFAQLDTAICECFFGAGDYQEMLKMCDKFLDQAAAL